MTAYILRRIVISLPVLIGITLFTFVFINLAPGDPVSALIPPNELARMNPLELAARRRALGLDKPIPVRYAIWLGQLVRGNLGYSYADQQPVTADIGARIGPTLELTSTALVLALLVACPLGLLSALRQYSRLDYLLTFACFLMLSVPGFFVALGAIYIFSLRLNLLPTSGMMTPGQPGSLGDHLEHLLMPAVVLSLGWIGPFMRYVRASMLEVISQEYVTTARAKGLSNRVVLLRHAFRNALIPLITIVGLSLPSLLGGAVLIETVFSWPGMGWLSVTAVFQRDYPVLMGLGLISALVVLASNLLTDICYAIADPRIRYH